MSIGLFQYRLNTRALQTRNNKHDERTVKEGMEFKKKKNISKRPTCGNVIMINVVVVVVVVDMWCIL